MTSGTIQANDRAEALRDLKAKGYVPVTLVEGKIGPLSEVDNRWRAINGKPFALVLLSLIIVGGVWFLTKKTTDTKPNNDVSLAKKTERVAFVKKQKGESPKTKVVKSEKTTPRPPEQPKVETLAVAPPLARKTEPPERVVQKNEVAKPEPPKEEPNRPYKTASEQLIAMLGLPGEESPPLPISSDETLEEDFEVALTNVITVLDTEDNQSVARKENVAWIKQFIKQGQAMGWTPGDYIRELEKKRKEEAALRQNAHQIMTEIEDNEQALDAKKIKSIRDQLNKELTDQGVLPLEEPEE